MIKNRFATFFVCCKFEFVGVLLIWCSGTLSPAYSIKFVCFVVPLLSFLSTAKEKIAKEMPFKREIPLENLPCGRSLKKVHPPSEMEPSADFN